MQSNARVGGRKKRGNRSRNSVDRGRVAGVPSALTTLSQGVGFPRKLHARHRYADAVILTSTTGAVVSYQWSCNGMYDPNITGTGHQPLYFDQLGAIYDHYTVFRSTIKYEILGTQTFAWSAYIDDDTTITSSVVEAAEQVGGKTGLLSSQAVRPQVIQLSWDAKKFFGGDIFDNDNLQGTTAANPTEQSYFTILASTSDLSTGNLTIKVVIEYEVVWDELRTQTIS